MNRMSNTKYSRGAAFERAVIKILEAAGMTASRTAGSHGALDVWAISKHVVRLIQCKTSIRTPTAKMYLDDLRKISKVAAPANCAKELWIKQNRKTTKILIL